MDITIANKFSFILEKVAPQLLYIFYKPSCQIYQIQNLFNYRYLNCKTTKNRSPPHHRQIAVVHVYPVDTIQNCRENPSSLQIVERNTRLINTRLS